MRPALSIASTLLSNGCDFVAVGYPSMYQIGSLSATPAMIGLMLSYLPQIDALDNGTTIFVGGRDIIPLSANNLPGTTDGTHMTPGGATGLLYCKIWMDCVTTAFRRWGTSLAAQGGSWGPTLGGGAGGVRRISLGGGF